MSIPVSSFFDRNSPWVLVPNGSFMGVFDFVPKRLRVGPWHPLSHITLFVLSSALLMTGVYWEGWTQTNLVEVSYPAPYSVQWWYHTIGFVWMCYIMNCIACNPKVGFGAWITYTVQSWTLLTLRHALCALAPWSVSAKILAERTRFLCAVTTTQTFVVWNFFLMPFICYVYFKDDPSRRRGFIKFCCSFVMLNIHGLNMVFCWLNVGTWGSPPRNLEFADFYVSVVALLIYVGFYLGILDRIGVHLYPVFSPRTAWTPLIWTALVGVYVCIFKAWKWLLLP